SLVERRIRRLGATGGRDAARVGRVSVCEADGDALLRVLWVRRRAPETLKDIQAALLLRCQGVRITAEETVDRGLIGDECFDVRLNGEPPEQREVGLNLVEAGAIDVDARIRAPPLRLERAADDVSVGDGQALSRG